MSLTLKGKPARMVNDLKKGVVEPLVLAVFLGGCGGSSLEEVDNSQH